MGDIFDKVDIFDQIAPPKSVADQAKERLSAQSGGLPPEWSKGRTFSPDDIKFSDPETHFLRGFLAAVNPLNVLNTPLLRHFADPTYNPSADLIARIQARGDKPTTADLVSGIATEASGGLLPNFLDTAKESYHRGEANQSRSDMYGGVAGAAVSAALLPKAFPTREGAAAQYGKVFGPKADPAAVAEAVPRLLEEGITTSNPPVDLVAQAQQRASAATPALDQAIGQSAPVDRNAVLSGIEDAKMRQMNRVPAPQGTPSAQAGIASAEPAGPDAEAIIAKLNDFADNIRSNSRDGVITPQNARKLRQGYDRKPGARGYFSDSDKLPPTEIEARMATGDAIRNVLNRDPAVAAANKDVSGWMRTADLASDAPAKKSLLTPWEMERAAGGAALAPFHPAAGSALIASTAIPMLIRFMRSPAYNSMSAVAKYRLASLVDSGNLAGATRLAAAFGAIKQNQDTDASVLRGEQYK